MVFGSKTFIFNKSIKYVKLKGVEEKNSLSNIGRSRIDQNTCKKMYVHFSFGSSRKTTSKLLVLYEVVNKKKKVKLMVKLMKTKWKNLN